MARMARGKRRRSAPDPLMPTDWQPEELVGQCLWCGKVHNGPQAGESDVLLGGRTTTQYCPDCSERMVEAGHREYERLKLERESIPEEHWPPRLVSPLEERTGSPYGQGVSPEGVREETP